VVLELLFLDVFRRHHRCDFQLLIVSGLSFILLSVLRSLPEFVTGYQLNVVIHRSIFSVIFLLVIAIPSLISSIYYLFGATPEAEDLSRIPIILLPSVLIIILYFVTAQVGIETKGGQ
jgi:hypothetical protein